MFLRCYKPLKYYSMSIKLKLALVTLFLGCSLAQPVHAQWAKVGKAVSKQAVKALSKTTSKECKTFTKGADRSSQRSVKGHYNAASSAAVASQYTTVKCSSCSGKGWYIYNGYKYQCSSCSGYGYKIIRR